MSTKRNIANHCWDFSEGAGEMTLTTGTSGDLTPVTVSSSIEQFDCCLENPPMGQPSDEDGCDNSSVESPSSLAFATPGANDFNNKFVASAGGTISSPMIGFHDPWTNPSMNQSLGCDTENGTVIDTDDSSLEVETSTSRAPSCYLDDPLSTPPGYWEDMEAAGLKKRKAIDKTPTKSIDKILDDGIRESEERSRRKGKMIACLKESPCYAKNKKLLSTLLKEIDYWANGRGNISSEEDE
jgi:hypothetical protein